MELTHFFSWVCGKRVVCFVRMTERKGPIWGVRCSGTRRKGYIVGVWQRGEVECCEFVEQIGSTFGVEASGVFMVRAMCKAVGMRIISVA